MLRADQVKAEIQSLLARHPELREDDEALVLSLESETDAMAVCERLVRKIMETEAFEDGVKAHIREMKRRQDLLEMRADNLRATLLSIMEAAGQKSLPLSIATLVTSRHQHVNIVERDLIPEEFRQQLAWEPLKNLIKAALKCGERVPGCTLSNPEPSLTIRVK